MNDSFSCFYHLNETSELEKIWKDDNTIFIFDTNVLLSLYSFQPESRKDFIKVLDSISDRIWIPFHVGLEFQKNRLYVIKNRRNTFKELNDEIDKLIDTIKFDKKPFTTLQTNFSLKKNYPTVFTKLNKNLEKINDSFNVLEKELKESLKEIKDEVSNFDKDRIFVNSNDYIRDEIGNLFKGEKLGRNIYDDQEKLNQLYLVGNERYKNRIPPGYEDEKKGEEEFYFDGLNYKRKFGDLIIFNQIIDFSKEKSIKNVIFISEDIKSDWRHIEDQGGDKILGARPELKREIYKKAGVEHFIIYQIEEFMKKTNEYLNVKIEDQTLRSIKISLEEDKHKKMLEDKMKSISISMESMNNQILPSDWFDCSEDEHLVIEDPTNIKWYDYNTENIKKNELDERFLARGVLEQQRIARKEREEQILARKEMEQRLHARTELEQQRIARRAREEGLLARKEMEQRLHARTELEQQRIARRAREEELLVRKEMEQRLHARTELEQQRIARRAREEELLARKEMEQRLHARTDLEQQRITRSEREGQDSKEQ